MVTATGVLIMATLFQISYTWLKHNRIEKIHVITMALLVVLGGATILFKEPRYLIWKVTIANWLFAGAFAGSHFIGHKPIIKRMMDHAVKLPEQIWTRLSISWISFFTVVGLLNLYIGFKYDFDTWVDFKFYGLMGLTLVFVLVQAVFIGKHAEELPQQNPEQQGSGDSE
jgi:intracellular septation protein